MQQNNISVSQPPPTAATTTTTTTVTTQPPTSNGNANAIDQAQFETDKRAVYKHPLFSLLALMLEKCEQATQGYVSTSSSQSNSSSPNGTPNGNCENDSFSRDIHAFVHLLEKEKGPLLTNDPELDGLMIKALQVLRIHLLELEKVQELCRDFCTRYIACLRGKMHSENLLRTDYPFESNNNLSNSNSPVNSPEQDSLTTQSGGYYGTADFLTGNDGNEFNNLPGAYNNLHINNNATAENNYNNHINHNNINNINNNNNNIINNNNATVRMTSSQTIPPLTSSSQLQSSAGIQSPQLQHQHQQQLSPHNNINNNNNNNNNSNNNNNNNNNNINSNQHHQQQNSIMSSQILGSTPLSQIGCPPLSLDQYQNQLSPGGGGGGGGGGCSSDELDSEIDSNNDDLSSNFSNNSGSKRQKRGILPKQATSVMRAWLFQHLVHPYPTEDEKRSIAAQTNLTLLQVNNWFINARRRILQPMLEHANDNTQNNSARKKSTSQTPSKRFWTDNVQTQNMNPSMIDPNIENISVNINRADSERSSNSNISNKLLTADNYYSSDDSNDSLVIDHDS